MNETKNQSKLLLQSTLNTVLNNALTLSAASTTPWWRVALSVLMFNARDVIPGSVGPASMLLKARSTSKKILNAEVSMEFFNQKRLLLRWRRSSLVAMIISTSSSVQNVQDAMQSTRRRLGAMPLLATSAKKCSAISATRPLPEWITTPTPRAPAITSQNTGMTSERGWPTSSAKLGLGDPPYCKFGRLIQKSFKGNWSNRRSLRTNPKFAGQISTFKTSHDIKWTY